MTSILNAPSANNILAQLQAAARKGVAQKSGQQGTGQSAVMAMIEKNNPEQAQKLKEQQDKNSQLLQQLSSSRSEQSAARKEAARQKVERLKAQIQMLKMMAAGDPKATARRAAQLARELASATKEYASAGGTATAGVAATGTPASTPAAAEGSTATSEATAAQATPATQAKTAPTADSASPDAAKDAASQTAPAAQDKEGNAVTGEEAAAAARDDIQKKLNEAKKAQGEREADDAFANEVRKLLNQLKTIIKSAKDKMRTEGGNGETQDTRDAENALRETERTLGDMANATASASFTSVSIVV